jgi:predicted HTH domain antitoxin
MVVTLPDDVAALKGMDEHDVKRELAVALYAGRKLTLVLAADLAGHGLFEFQAMLRDRGIPQHYTEADLDQDLLALRELPPK